MQFESSQQSWYVPRLCNRDHVVLPTKQRPHKHPRHQPSEPVLTARPRGEAAGTEPSGFPESDLSFSIPPNREGRKYSMKRAFTAWFDNKDAILSDAVAAAKSGEYYKLSRPEQIYHLDLYHSKHGEESVPGSEDNDAGIDTPVQQLPQREAPLAPPNLSRIEPPVAELPDTVLLPAHEISWMYLDPAGNEQGPFTGDVMQEWLTDGYLSFDLRIRRVEELTFQTLKQFCELVQNFVQPFKVPLAQLVRPPSVELQSQPSVANTGGSLSSSSSFQGTMASSIQPQQHQSQQQQPFSSNLYSQLMPQGGLGAANIRTPSLNHLFDFMGNEFPLMNQQFSGGQYGLEPMGTGLGLANGFGQLNMSSLLHQQIQAQQPLLSRANSGWGVDAMQSNIPTTPSAVAPAPLNIGQNPMAQAQLGQSGLGQTGPMSPWLNRVQTMSRVSSPFVSTTSLTGDLAKAEDPVLQDIHSSVVDGIFRDEEPARAEPAQEIQPLVNILSGDEPISISESIRKAEKSRESLRQAEISREARQAELAQAEKEAEPVNAQPEVPQAEIPVESVVEQRRSEDPKVLKTEIAVAETPAQPSIAPWAASSKPDPVKQDTPTMTLKQIQELEAERLQREKQLKAEMRQEIALANAIAASKLEEKQPEKVQFNWAKPSQPTAAKKTLAEIQKEEEAESARVRAALKLSASAKQSLASTLAASPDTGNGGWTTIASKKPAPKKPIQPVSGISYLAAGGAINPQSLRSTSASVVPTSTVNTTLIKENFLIWARSSMTNLYPSVSKDDLLEVFTALPVHGDSAQLISETIYSSSATMDGRRFAQEFIKKRQQVEKQIGSASSESWSSAIASSADKVATISDDGWSTSVKTKKKGRRA